MKLELISFSLCPYVQRSVITLKHKKADFSITYIDLESPPEWFERISPLGKVPLLRVNDRTTLFESAVINEYLDETIGPSMHPQDPLQRAFARAWIEYGSSLLVSQYQLTMATDASKLPELRREFFDDLGRLETVIQGPLFQGASLSLADAAYAPIFTRLFLVPGMKEAVEWKRMPKVRAWASALVELPAVRESVHKGFEDEYAEYCRAEGSALFATQTRT